MIAQMQSACSGRRVYMCTGRERPVQRYYSHEYLLHRSLMCLVHSC